MLVSTSVPDAYAGKEGLACTSVDGSFGTAADSDDRGNPAQYK